MKTVAALALFLILCQPGISQNTLRQADSLRDQGLLMPALMKYGEAMMTEPSHEVSYKIASTTALLWTSHMRDTSFYFLNHALEHDSTLNPLHDPHFLSLIDDPRWDQVVETQIKKYEAKLGTIPNKTFMKELFRMIIKDQGFMYAGNIERRKYMENGGHFRTPAIFPVLAMEEKLKMENEARLQELLTQYGWPVASQVTEAAAAGAALIINHSTYELRSMYFPLLEEAFRNGEANPLLYAQMRDRLLVEEGKQQLYGTQTRFNNLKRELHALKDPEQVDKRRAEIGLGPLSPYLKARFDMDWNVPQKD